MCGWIHSGAKPYKQEVVKELTSDQGNTAPKEDGRFRAIVKVDENGVELAQYPSLVAAAEANALTIAVVKAHCRGKLKNPFKRTRGYTLRYANDKQEAAI